MALGESVALITMEDSPAARAAPASAMSAQSCRAWSHRRPARRRHHRDRSAPRTLNVRLAQEEVQRRLQSLPSFEAKIKTVLAGALHPHVTSPAAAQCCNTLRAGAFSPHQHSSPSVCIKKKSLGQIHEIANTL
jgi:hypothetical protein